MWTATLWVIKFKHHLLTSYETFLSTSSSLTWQSSYITIFSYITIWYLHYIIVASQLFVGEHSGVLWLSFGWTFCFCFSEVNVRVVFIFAFLCVWLLQCSAHKCFNIWIPSHHPKALICIVCTCLYCILFFISNYQCEVTAQGARKRCIQVVLLSQPQHTTEQLLTLILVTVHIGILTHISSSSVTVLKYVHLIRGHIALNLFLWTYEYSWPWNNMG